MQGLLFQVQGKGTVGAKANVAVGEGVGKGWLGLPCQRMVQRHDQRQRVIAKRLGLQIAGIHRRGEDANVCRTLAQSMGNTQAGQFLYIDVDAGVALEKIGERFGQVFGQGRRVA
ncbi:hypothetical protein D3C85_1011220 [compost metagenome]